MRTLCWTAVLAMIAGRALAEGKAEKPSKLPAGYAWEQNYDQAKLKAAEEGKLLFIDLYKES